MAHFPLTVRSVSSEERAELDILHRCTRNARLRSRVQITLFALEQEMIASEIAVLVRDCEQTIRNWIKRFNAEGVGGLRNRLLAMMGQPHSLWALQHLANFMSEETGIRFSYRRRAPDPQGLRH